MNSHLTPDQIERYRRRTLPASELLTMDDHIAACQSCRDAASAGAVTDISWSVADRTEHLAYEQVEAYVDRELDRVDLEIVNAHMDMCSHCAAEVRDLESFKTGFSRAPIPQPKTEAPAAIWERLMAWFRVSVPGIAVVAAMALIAGFFWIRKDHNARIVLSLNDGGGRITLNARGSVAGPVPESYRSAVTSALESHRVETPASVADLIGNRGTLLAGEKADASFALLEPLGTAVNTDRPLFRWQPLGGASGYVIRVYDSAFNVANSSARLSQTQWTSDKPLRRGTRYTWQVTAFKSGQEVLSPTPPAPEARFRILDAAKAEELRRARQAYVNSHLVMGLLYARAGALDEAERELINLKESNPQSAVAQELLVSIQQLRQK